MKYTHRYLARIILEAKTALFVGSGETSLLKDALIQKDHYGFPMIQGTSLMGVLRHALEDGKAEAEKRKLEAFLGCQLSPQEIQKREVKNRKKPKAEQAQKIESGFGSKIKISSAYLLFPDGKIAESLKSDGSIPYQSSLSLFDDLPSRQHVRITDKGVADASDGGLFENEVSYKGCRFIFELELKGDGSEREQWYSLLRELNNPLFRLGQGTRNGYGKLQVNSCQQRIFDLTDLTDYKTYLHFEPSFNLPFDDWQFPEQSIEYGGATCTHYQLYLTPDDFFIFGDGYGDEEVDNKPVEEKVIVYDEANKELRLVERSLIPASSIKGALSHRTCFHYNKLKSVYADQLDPLLHEWHLGIKNTAVATLFGVGAGTDKISPTRGQVIIDDLYCKEMDNEKIINHVAIDRFTGGAIDGALFSEKVSQRDGEIILDIWLEQKKMEVEDYDKFITAFEEALKDVCKGFLPLGGMTTKGHGIFTGQLIKDEQKIYPNDTDL